MCNVYGVTILRALVLQEVHLVSSTAWETTNQISFVNQMITVFVAEDGRCAIDSDGLFKWNAHAIINDCVLPHVLIMLLLKQSAVTVLNEI